ncbi:LysR family transcriptional regulator [Rhizobium sp. Leaf384]|uniref:LysR family transcriptional regulator n=1 Tax=unclassified Rhizobium TaxID=2613769 RepID=UPI0007152B55|nr:MULTISPECIES: LysR family transcriptional regulator [unclassified Rhizobium]KQS75519.1 LysR family transcriptional regulator [Rhizobium sp. Leaf384]KQS75768.1 LysR family transcriptional regulator [Rhizobium sp. Leaf383]
MDQLTAMRVFVRVVETGNFTRAASTLSMPKTTVTNYVQSLEARLQATLLNRTTRRVIVTTDGALYYERAVQILSELDELDSSLSNSQSQPSGRLRVEMAGAFADLVVIPALCDFYQRYPLIKLDIGVGDRLVDYVAENVDCALRGGTPGDQSLIARKVGDMTMKLCAAPLYLEKFGEPHEPEDLTRAHVAVGYLLAQSGRIMDLELENAARAVAVTPNYILSVNDARSYVNAAIGGLGVAAAPGFMIDAALSAGTLRQVLPGWRVKPIPLYVVYPPRRHLSNKVRVFVDWLAKLMQTLPADRVLKTGRLS